MALGIALHIVNHGRLPVAEVDSWYGAEAMAARTGIDGVLSAERFVGIEDPRVSIVVSELRDAGVAASAAWRAPGSPRASRIAEASDTVMIFEGRQTLPGDVVAAPRAGGLLVNGMSAAAAGEPDFNRWYDEEHIPALSAVPGCILARRFVTTNGCAQKYLALYHLESPDVVKTAAWARAVETPWTSRVRPYMQNRLRVVCRAA